MAKIRMTKDIVPDNFTMSLAVFDAIPVILFCISMILGGFLFESKLFIIGAVLCFLAGLFKVLWKVIVVLKRKNIWWMFLQMRIMMPIGMLLMIIGLIFNSDISINKFILGFTYMPSMIFFILGIIGMILMGIFAFKLDSSDVKSNWIEQTTNGIAQLSILIGVLFLVFR